MASYVGERMRLTTKEGVYEGKVTALDLNHGRITLDKVVAVKSGKVLKGLHHFFRSEIINVEPLGAPKKKKVEDLDEDAGPSILKRKQMPRHLKQYQKLDDKFRLITDEVEPTVISSGEESSPSRPHFEQRQFPIKKVSPKEPSPASDHGSGSDQGFASDRSSALSSGVATATGASNPASGDAQKNYLEHYIIVNEVDQTFKHVIEHILSEKLIGFAMEGVRLGRHGRLCWIQIATSENIFLFDMVKLGKVGMQQGLARVLEAPRIVKVIHDSRPYSDLFFHQYGVNLVNVFDTQVAAVMLYRMNSQGDLPRYVEGLGVSLHQHLGVPEEALDWGKHREQHIAEDQSIWSLRPVPKHLVDVMVQKVRYLRHLKAVMQEKMLADFTDGVDLYLSVHRDANQEQLETHDGNLHLLPVAFKDLAYEATRRREDYSQRFPSSRASRDEHGFRDNALPLFDTKVIFSHNSIWHGRIKDFDIEKKRQEKYEAVRARRELEHARELANRDESLIKPREDMSAGARSRLSDGPTTPPRSSGHRVNGQPRASPSQRTRQCRFDEDDGYEPPRQAREDLASSHAPLTQGRRAHSVSSAGRDPPRLTKPCRFDEDVHSDPSPHMASQRNKQELLVFIPAGVDLSARVRDMNRVHKSSSQPCTSEDDGDTYGLIPTNRLTTSQKLLPRAASRADSAGNSVSSSDNSESDQGSDSYSSACRAMQGVRVTSTAEITSPPSTSGRGQLLLNLLNKDRIPGNPSTDGSTQEKSTQKTATSQSKINEAAWNEASQMSYKGASHDLAGRGRGVPF